MSDYNVREVLIRRDGMSESEVDKFLEQLFVELMEALERGDDIEELWMDATGLEPDYMDSFLF